MADYIRREQALGYPLSYDHYDKKNGDIKFINGVESYREYIEGLPSVDAVEQKHGHWIRNAPNRKFMQEMKGLGFAKGMGIDSIFYTCSECNLWGSPYMKYCSHCGAKMRGDNDGN